MSETWKKKGTGSRKGKKNSDENASRSETLKENATTPNTTEKESKPGIKARRTPNQRSSVLTAVEFRAVIYPPAQTSRLNVTGS